MLLVLTYVCPEEIPQALELAESLGAEGGEMVFIESLGIEQPEFRVHDDLVTRFIRGFEAAGITSVRVSHCLIE